MLQLCEHVLLRAFHTYVWHDQHGNPHTITQAEGGEQGDPLMPALFSLGQRAALHTVQEELQDGESLFAFLDDIYVLVPPNRVRPVYDLLSHHLFTSAHIRLNAGKARVWNANGVPPPGIAPLGHNVWVGNQALPAEEQGLMILGTPVGSSQYQQHQLAHPRTQHDQLFSASRSWRTRRLHGCCSCIAPAPAATTNFGCCPQTSRPGLLQTTTSQWQQL